jgi:hypothetical protein
MTTKNDIVKCSECGTLTTLDAKWKIERYNKNGRAMCSKECTKEFCRRVSSETMARTNRKYASARMKARNPMHNAATRAKVATTLRAINHKPRIQGGNGRPPSVPQKLLALALGWDMEVIVPTRQKKNSGYPSHYKIDIGNQALMIGVEIDGESHSAIKRQEQDRKKEKFLRSIGWTILRFKNKEVLNNLDNCVDRVMSIISK